ncbi:MAG: hypothetical protein MUC49_13925 [Raineya sp.]|jgi:hypothetical protein|nr:hypothetical protein [Raineya sp.]
MKIIFILLFWIYTLFIFGQRVHYSSTIYPQDLPQWEYKDFINYNVKKVSAFSYEAKSFGKLKRKGVLLYQKELDKKTLKIFGINSVRMLSTHGISPLSKWRFENFYNKNGLIIKEINYPILTKKENEGYIYKHETLYEYLDTLLLRKTSIHHQIDTVLKIQFKDSTIHEYEYNNKTLETKFYTTQTPSYFLTPNLQSTSSSEKKCYGCHAKQLEQITTYTTDSLIKTISYYYTNGKLRLKKYFSYTKNKLPKTQIDSIWHYQTDIPYLEESIEFEYSDTSKRKIKTRYNEQKKIISTSVIVYDKENRLLSDCYSSDNYPENCSYQSYTYQNKLLMSSTFKSEYGYKYSIKTDFSYNTKGLLTEEKIYLNGKLKSAVKYFYEYY